MRRKGLLCWFTNSVEDSSSFRVSIRLERCSPHFQTCPFSESNSALPFSVAAWVPPFRPPPTLRAFGVQVLDYRGFRVVLQSFTLPVGSDPITASYGGNANFLPSSASMTEVVTP